MLRWSHKCGARSCSPNYPYLILVAQTEHTVYAGCLALLFIKCIVSCRVYPFMVGTCTLHILFCALSLVKWLLWCGSARMRWQRHGTLHWMEAPLPISEKLRYNIILLHAHNVPVVRIVLHLQNVSWSPVDGCHTLLYMWWSRTMLSKRYSLAMVVKKAIPVKCMFPCCELL